MVSMLTDVAGVKGRRAAAVVLADDGREAIGERVRIASPILMFPGEERRVDPDTRSAAVLPRGVATAERAPFIGQVVELIGSTDA